eukprot:GHRR01000022.1.p1 GENE.GHRR01000022.1~~GHRR01000022.1.p1  ORF type:complete len:181 (+),score=65.17 GHRR01000022.1:209-751(+)
MQRIKEALKPGKHRHHDEHQTVGTTGYGTTDYGSNLEHNSVASSDSSSGLMGQQVVGTGTAEVPVVYTTPETNTVGQHDRGIDRVNDEVCGQKTFTEVEDRPVVKERVERYVEHNPVEKQYVVETRFVGERAVPSANGATVIDTNEYVVDAAAPGAKCPANTGAILDQAIDGITGRRDRI